MEPSESTRAVIERARAGDREAFDALVESHRDRLGRHVRRRMGERMRSRAEPEDALQETFVRAFQSIARFAWRGDDSFLSWLKTIADHVLLEAASRAARDLSVPLDHEAAVDGGPPEQALRRGERFDRLEAALEGLRSVDELHTLLKNAGFDPPYLLVGHSLGGLHIRLFAIRYPGEVAGLVFVDPAHEHAYTRWEEEFPEIYAGWLRENDKLHTSPGASREWTATKAILPGLGAPGPLPDVPVLVLTSGHPFSTGGIFTQEFVDAYSGMWFEAHEMLAQSVSRGTHILAAQSGHQIQEEQPQLVIDAVRQVLEAARSLVR